MINQPTASGLHVPAIFLIVLALICLVVLALGMAFDFTIVRISMNHRGQPYLDAQTRIAYAIVMGFINLLIIRGGWHMIRLGNYRRAKNAAILSIIPLVGPCFILGIPFGIWALILMNRPSVKESFSIHKEEQSA